MRWCLGMAFLKTRRRRILTCKHASIQRVATLGPDVISAFLTKVCRDLFKAFVVHGQAGVTTCLVAAVALAERRCDNRHGDQDNGWFPGAHFRAAALNEGAFSTAE